MALSDPCRELLILENEERTSVVADEIAARLRILGRLISTIKFSPGSPIRTATRTEVPTYEERSRDLKAPKSIPNDIPPLVFKNFPDKEYTPDELYVYIERKESHLLRENGGTEAIAHALKTDLRRGIDTNSLEWRVKKYGTNSLPPAEENSFWGHIKEALGDTMMIILICAAFTSLILNLIPSKNHDGHGQTGWIEGAAILCSVVVVVLVTATNNYQKEKKFQQLSEETAKKESNVIRDGIRVTLDSTELVVGDVLLVHGGDVLPADGLFIDGVDLKCDESTATGETDQLTKDTVKDPFFLSGTSLVEGAGRILVIGVGENSFSGRQAMLTREPPKPTPLQEKLSELADDIGFYGGLAAGLTLIVLSAKQLYFIYHGEAEAWDIKPFLNFIIVAITIVVVAIPEGLPLAVTIALAYSMRNMMADNCLVRIMAACETMGGATAVCSDKTGTLTTNNMTVVQAWVAERRIIVPGTGIPCPKKRIQNNIENCHRCEGEVAIIQCEDCRKSSFCKNCFGEIHKGTWANHERREIKLQKSNLLDGLDDSAIDLFATALSLNCTAEEKLTEDGSSQWIGNKTEIGMLRFLKEKVEKDPREIKLSVSEQDLKQFPFNSDKKMMTTVVKSRGRGSKLLVKGAPDFLLPRCSQYLASDGKPKPMTKDKQNYLKAVITDMALLGNRTILVGMCERDSNSFPVEEPEDSLICVAILGIQDPIRSEVPEAISICQKAGIVVRMVTGDNKQTAVSIAEKAGIYHKDYGIVMEGKEFRQMAEEDPEKLRVNILPKLEVLARSSPKDKYVLVDLLRKQDQVTAVTGDGTNDAPALKLADVGFAMKSGTDIAKLASDIILLDDNFVSVVKACMWGRNVNDNIRKFLQFQVTVNVVGVLLTFIGATASEHNVTPLNPVQLLWLNLIMDTLAALALATEQPSLELLDRAPLHKSGGLISPRMWVNIIGHAIFQLCIMLTMMFYGIDYLVKCDESEKDAVHSTVIFNTFIFIQIWNEFNARKLHGEFNVFHGLMRSKGHLWVTLVMVAFQVFAIEVAGKFFGTVSLTLEQWAVCVGIGALCIPWAWVLHFVPAREQKVENRFNQKERQRMQAAGRDMVNRIRVAKAFSQIRHPRRRSSLAELSPLGSKEAPFSTTRRILT